MVALKDWMARILSPVRANCRVPDEYLLKSKRPLLFSREVLTAVVAQWTHPETTC